MVTLIEHPGIGEVVVSVSRRSRRISISVRPPGRVRLSMPPGVPVKEALRFLESKQEWISAAKEKMAAKAVEQGPVSMPYSTRRHTLKLNPSNVERISVKLRGGEITVTYPITTGFGSPEVQQAIKRGIEEAWRAEAKELLPARTEELARRYGFAYRSVAVRNTRSRWGSCSARNDISLSIRLMKLPDPLVDYIILHELCHTVHKNHGPRFHRLLDEVCGGRHGEFKSLIRKQSINIL